MGEGVSTRLRASGFRGRVGVARRDITPPVGIAVRNWGAATTDVATGIHRPLLATALWMRSGDTQAVVVDLDLGWITDHSEYLALTEAVAGALGIDRGCVLIALSHTHSGPCTARARAVGQGAALVPAYLDGVAEAAASAAVEARATAEPASITWAAGRCDLARNRDLPDPAGDRVVTAWNPDEPSDDTVVVGRVATATGRPMATIVNYACHPTTLAWQNELVSPDYVGALREAVEASTGGVCLFLQGASGELAPIEQYTGDVSVADRHGRRLAWSVLAAIESMLPPAAGLDFVGVVESGAPLGIWEMRPSRPLSPVLRPTAHVVGVPLKPDLPTVDEIRAARCQATDRVALERLDRSEAQRNAVGDGTTTPFPAAVWQIGEALLVATPGEAYSRLQTELRARLAPAPVVVLNIANGAHLGYLPPRERYDGDVYQVWQTALAPGCLELVTDEIAAHGRWLIADAAAEQERMAQTS